MDIFPRRRSGAIDIISLLVLYFILFFIILLFTEGLVSDVSPKASMPMGTVVLLVLFISAALLGLLAFFLVRLAKSRAAGGTGTRLRFRLVSYFIVIVLLSSIPQAALFWSAVTRSAEAWFNARIERAILGSNELAIDFSLQMRKGLSNAAERDLPDIAARYILRRPALLYGQLAERYPSLAAVQTFEEGAGYALAEHSFSGKEVYRLDMRSSPLSGEGEMPSLSSDYGYAIRYAKAIEAEGRRFMAIVTFEYPENWTRITDDIVAARDEAERISAFIPRYRLALAGLYALFALPMLLIAILLALRMSDLVLKPVASLEQATNRVAKGNFAVRLLSRSQDDFAALTTSFNHMVGELDRFRSILIQNEKVTVWQDIAQKLAHEIKNPLTPIKLSAERVLRRHRADPESAREIVEPAMLAIIQEVEGLTSLLSDFKSFARLPEPQFEWTDLRETIADIARMYAASNPAVEIDFSALGPGHRLRADRGHLRQLFVNLLGNAIDAMGGSGRIWILADLVKRSNTRYCRIQVRDSGAGIPEEIQDRLFTPYFTTKENGTGLGLSIVEHIVIDHKGEIWFESEPGKGTTFFIDLPSGDPPDGERVESEREKTEPER